ncbi:hypothetical protein EB155_02610 [archaeon]|jgi:hypothetical protein|nr:hypothetical protein [archaeon]NDB54816.1 hypothetical protein [archaeon]NDB78734.1 hypothetical protein [archaeon]
MVFDAIPTEIVILLFPVIVLVLWQLMFNSQNAVFTKAIVEGGFMLLGIPVMILTFISIPTMAILFWANTQGYGRDAVTAILTISLIIILIVEYFWVKRQVKLIEERENMSIIDVIKRNFDSEYRKSKKEEKIENRDQAISFFDEISDMNKKRRELDQEEKEKLKKALLGDLDEN